MNYMRATGQAPSPSIPACLAGDEDRQDALAYLADHLKRRN
jgi:hypothetical protein